MKNSTSSRFRLNAVSFALLLAVSGHALAVDTGKIVSGAGNITHSGATTQINQSSDKLIVNWNNFNVANGEAVNIAQPSATSAILNRVTGNLGATQIDGALNANGRVFIVNPNGVVFGQHANVNVGSLVASTLSISDESFNHSASPTLSGSSNATGTSVVNNGSINASERVILLAPDVINNGSLSAGKSVALAAGYSASVGFGAADTGLYSYYGFTADPASGTVRKASSINNGQINTHGDALMAAINGATTTSGLSLKTSGDQNGTINAGGDVMVAGFDRTNIGGNIHARTATLINTSYDGRTTMNVNADSLKQVGNIYIQTPGSLMIDGALEPPAVILRK
jgi:filamentous hemagglutinin family protein